MSAEQQAVEALKAEVAQLRVHWESIAPKFGAYDQMLQANGPWKAEVEKMLLAQGAEQKDLIVKQDETVAGLRDLYDEADKSLREINVKLQSPFSAGGDKKDKWQLTRPKDMDPGIFSGKDEEWPQWKESMEDYIDAVHPGLKDALLAMSKAKGEVLEEDLRKAGYVEDQWKLREEIFKLLKRKTSVEARNIVMCIDKLNGYEVWRTLTMRFEPHDRSSGTDAAAKQKVQERS